MTQEARITHNITARGPLGVIVSIRQGSVVSVLGDVTRPRDPEPITEVIVRGPVIVVAGDNLGSEITLASSVWIPTRALVIEANSFSEAKGDGGNE